MIKRLTCVAACYYKRLKHIVYNSILPYPILSDSCYNMKCQRYGLYADSGMHLEDLSLPYPENHSTLIHLRGMYS